MRLGFYTNYTPEIAEFAQRVGFRSMELSAWPGSALDAGKVTDKKLAEIRKDLQTREHRNLGIGLLPQLPVPRSEGAGRDPKLLLEGAGLGCQDGSGCGQHLCRSRSF